MLRTLGRYWHFGLLAVLTMIGEVAVDLWQPRLMATIVDEGVLGSIPNPDLIATEGLRMFGIVLLGLIFGLSSDIAVNICAQRYGNELRKKCFSRCMYFSQEKASAFTTGSLITRLTSDTVHVQNMVSQLIRGGVRSAVFFAAGSAALVTLSVDFLQVIIVALPLLLLEIICVVRTTTPLFSLLQDRIDALNSALEADVDGIRVIRPFVREEAEAKRFEDRNRELSETQLTVLRLMSLLRPGMNIVLNCAVVAILYLGGLNIEAAELAPGRVIAAVTYMTQILNGMMMLALIFQTISRGRTSAARLREILSTSTGLEVMAQTKQTHDEKNMIVFRDVSFSYPHQKERALSHISLTVAEKTTLGLVGATGSGKSSLVQLLPRLYDVTEGEVLIAGQDVRCIPIPLLRQNISFVFQKSELFAATITENICLGRPPDEKALHKALETAQAADFVSRLPDGAASLVVEGGASLSGGQRQRLALARALFRPAPILILDDATSALDLKTEKAFFDALIKNYPDLTVLIVAQRIATVRCAEQIAVLDNGRLLATGRHEELLSHCAIYREIARSQLNGGQK